MTLNFPRVTGRCIAGWSFALIIIGYILNWDLQCASTLNFDLPEVFNFIILPIQWRRVFTVRHIKHNWFKSHGESWALHSLMLRKKKFTFIRKLENHRYINEEEMSLQLCSVCVCVSEFVCTDYYHHNQNYTENIKWMTKIYVKNWRCPLLIGVQISRRMNANKINDKVYSVKMCVVYLNSDKAIHVEPRTDKTKTANKSFLFCYHSLLLNDAITGKLR